MVLILKGKKTNPKPKPKLYGNSVFSWCLLLLMELQSLSKTQSVCYESTSIQISESQAVNDSGVLKANSVL